MVDNLASKLKPLGLSLSASKSEYYTTSSSSDMIGYFIGPHNIEPKALKDIVYLGIPLGDTTHLPTKKQEILSSLEFWIGEDWPHPYAAQDCWDKYSASLLRSSIAHLPQRIVEAEDLRSRKLLKDSFKSPTHLSSAVLYKALDTGGAGLTHRESLKHACVINMWALMLHHPNDWLQKSARTHYYSGIDGKLSKSRLWTEYILARDFFPCGPTTKIPAPSTGHAKRCRFFYPTRSTTVCNTHTALEEFCSPNRSAHESNTWGVLS